MDFTSNLKEKLISSKEVFSGKFLNVVVDTVELPNGKQSTRDCIRHPGASAIIPLDNEGNIVMVEQYRHAVGKLFLEVPAGKIEEGHTPLITAEKELEEETGYTASEVISIGSFFPCIGYSDEEIHFFIAKGLQKSTTNLDEDEFVQVRKVPFEQVWQWCLDGTIDDGKTITAMLKTRQYLEGKI